MEEDDEELYDDTVPNEAYNKLVTESRQAEGKAEKTSVNQPRGGPRTENTSDNQPRGGPRTENTSVNQPRGGPRTEKTSVSQPRGGPRTDEQANTTNVRPKRQSQDKVKTTEAPVTQGTIEIPSTEGLYYFDGEKFTEHRPTESDVYVPGSDYCRVTEPKSSDGSGYESDTSTSESSQEDVKVRSSLSSGLQTLNINISLNVADLVKNTLSGRKRRKKTRKKKARTLQRRQHSIYEFTDVSEGVGVQTGTDIQSASTERVLAETSVKNLEKPPPIPPKMFQSDTANSKVSPENHQKKEKDNIYGSARVMQIEETRLKRYFSESQASLTFPEATGSATDGLVFLEYPYAKVNDPGSAEVDDAGVACTVQGDLNLMFYMFQSLYYAHELYSSDSLIQNEVKKMLDNDWCYVYANRQAAEAKLSDKNLQDGSFAVICEDIEENHHYPFTLLLKYKGKVTRTPIKKVQEYRGKRKYELLNVKKDTVEKLIKHFKEKQLPDYKLKLL